MSNAEQRAAMGVEVPGRVVLGTVSFGAATPPDEAERILGAWLDRGLTWLDTAAGYADGATEVEVGRLMRLFGRDRVFVATKFGLAGPPADTSADEIVAAVVAEAEGSLRRLGADRIDLLQMHRPWFDVAPEPVVEALGRLVRQGKVGMVGASNFPAWVLKDHLRASEAADLPAFRTQQSGYNLLDRRIENETIPFCTRHGVALLTWSPTASGLLSGRYAVGAPPPADSRASTFPGFASRLTPENLGVVEALAAAAAGVGLTIPRFALAWTLTRPGIGGVVVGPRTYEHLADALAVLDHLDIGGPLPAEEEIDRIVLPGGRVIDFGTLTRPAEPVGG